MKTEFNFTKYYLKQLAHFSVEQHVVQRHLSLIQINFRKAKTHTFSFSFKTQQSRKEICRKGRYVEEFTGMFSRRIFELCFYLRKTGARVTRRMETVLSVIKSNKKYL